MLLGFAMLSLMFGSILSWRAEKELTAWTTERHIPTKTETQIVEKWLYQAKRYTMNNPEVSEQLGRLYEWESLQARVGASNDVQQNQEKADLEAKEQYMASLRSRPGWAYDWVNLGVVLHNLGKKDESDAVLERAVRYGSYEPRVLQRMVELNLQNWPEEKNKNHMETAAQNGLQSFPKMTLARAEAYGLLSDFCNRYARQGAEIKNCEQRISRL